MPKFKPLKRVLFSYVVKPLIIGLLGFLFFFVTNNFQTLQRVNATSNTTVNFQARLESISGALVPDGNYNVEFKLYNALTSSGSSQGSCSGDAACLWVETYTGAHLVRVADGYLSVSLGSLSSFPSTINWNQNLWLGMNIGGTGAPSWDGEMSPRIQLTASPYAFTAGQLATFNAVSGYSAVLQFTAPTATDTITLPDATGTVCLQTSSACGFVTTGSLGGTAFIQNGNTFGTVAVLGTTDNFGLNLETHGNTAESLSNTGQATFKNPSNSTTAFQVQNATGVNLLAIDTADNVVTIDNTTNAGSIGAWINDTANPTPQATYFATSVTYNGYVYYMGGQNNTGVRENYVSYAPISANGSIGTWVNETGTSLLPQGLTFTSSVAYNGYIYVIGGLAGSYLNTVYYAPINSNGSIGAWITETGSSLLPQGLRSPTSVEYNGYIYTMGGLNSSNATVSTVYYTPINANGSVGTWVTDTASPLPQALLGATSIVYNGYVYVMGGQTSNGSGWIATVYYAPINPNGSIGSWTNDTTSPLPQALFGATSVTYNGYVYVMGGWNSGLATVATVYYAPINPNGSIGSWTNDTTNPIPQALDGASSIVNNGYAYELGGTTTNTNNPVSTVYYAPLASTAVQGNLTVSGSDLINGNEAIAGSDTIGGNLSAIGSGSLGSLSITNVLNTPAAPTVAEQGTAGAITYDYEVSAYNAGGTSMPSAPTQITNGNATLSTTNWNNVTWTGVNNSTGYNIYRTISGGTPSTTGQVGSINTTSLLPVTPTAYTTGTYTFTLANTPAFTVGQVVTLVGFSTSSGNINGNYEVTAVTATTITINTSTSYTVTTEGTITGTLGFDDSGIAISTSTIPTTGTAGTETLQTNSSTALQVQNTAGNNVFNVNTTVNTVNLGSPSAVAGSLVLYNSTNANTVTLTTGATTGNYSLTLPVSAPSTAGLCLQDSTTTQLSFGACANTNPSITEVTGAEWDAHGSGSAVTTLGVTPVNQGDLLILTTQIPTSGDYVKSISGGGVSNWSQVTFINGNGTVNRVEMWMGQVTTTGAGTITVTYNTSPGTTNEIVATEFTASGVSANTAWGVENTGGQLNSTASTTITLPSLMSAGPSELYIGYAQSQNAGSAGSTSGFSYIVTGQNNIIAYASPTTAGNTYQPTASESSGQSNTEAAIITAFINSTAINNSISVQQANYNVQAATANSVAGVLQANVSGTGDILDLRNGSGLNVTSIGSTGNALFQASANTASAFVIDDANSNNIVSVNSNPYTASSSSMTNWSTSSTTLPLTTDQASAVSANGFIYLLGGINIGTGVYYTQPNPTTGVISSWTPSGNSLPQSLYGAQADVYNNYIYVLGGVGAGANVYYASINPVTGAVGSWTTSGNTLPQAVYNAASFAANGYIYDIGGTSGALNTVYYASLNPSTGAVGSWTTSGNTLPLGTSAPAYVTANGYVYVMGGWNGSMLNTVYYASLNPSTGAVGSWTTSGNTLPAIFQFGSAVTYNNYVYVMGGWNGTNEKNSLYIASLNPSTGAVGSWTTSGNTLPQPFNGAASVVVNGYVYTMGGQGNSGYLSTSYIAQLPGATTVAEGSVAINAALTVQGPTVYQNNANTSNAFQIQTASGTTLLNADTSNNRIGIGALSSPGTLTMSTATTGGSIAASTTYYYEVTAVDAAGGQTLPSPENSQATGSGTSTNTITISWSAVSGASSYDIYRGTSSGNEGTFFNTINTSYTDTGATGSTASPSNTSNAYTNQLSAGSNYLTTTTIQTGPTSSAPAAIVNQINSGQNILNLQSNGTNVLTVNGTGQTILQNTVNSASAFQINDAAGNNVIAVNTNPYTANTSSMGATWTNSTSTLLQTLWQENSVTYNNYIYVMGGLHSLSPSVVNTVYYASVNPSTGAVGSWNTSAHPLLQNLTAGTTVVNNGYIYYMGGTTNTSNTGAVNNVYYAQINPSTGDIGSWANSSSTLPQAVWRASSFIYNGYVYVMGGQNTAGTFISNVYFAQLNSSTGAVGAWNTSSSASLPQAQGIYAASAATYNGYAYVIGGYNATNGYLNTVYYGQINPTTGVISSWTTSTNVLPQIFGMTSSIAYDNYLYTFGGYVYNGGNTALANVYVSSLNPSTGAVGAWGNGVSLPQVDGFNSGVLANGYAYVLGGYNVSSDLNNVYYDSLPGVSVVAQGNTTINSALTIEGPSTFINNANSTTAFQVQNAAGSNILTVNTTSGNVALGTLSTIAGSLVLNSTSTGSVTIAAAATASSYTISLPTSAPSSTGLCLQDTTGGSNTQLAFGTCSTVNTSITNDYHTDGHGSGSSNTTTLAVNNTGVGNVGDVLVLTTSESTQSVTGVSGGGVTSPNSWVKVNALAGNGTASRVDMWIGVVTTVGSSTITVTYSGTPTTYEDAVTEFTAANVNSNTSWGVDSSGTSLNSSNVTTITYPALVLKAPVKFTLVMPHRLTGGGTAGSTSGF